MGRSIRFTLLLLLPFVLFIQDHGDYWADFAEWFRTLIRSYRYVVTFAAYPYLRYLLYTLHVAHHLPEEEEAIVTVPFYELPAVPILLPYLVPFSLPL